MAHTQSEHKRERRRAKRERARQLKQLGAAAAGTAEEAATLRALLAQEQAKSAGLANDLSSTRVLLSAADTAAAAAEAENAKLKAEAKANAPLLKQAASNAKEVEKLRRRIATKADDVSKARALKAKAERKAAGTMVQGFSLDTSVRTQLEQANRRIEASGAIIVMLADAMRWMANADVFKDGGALHSEYKVKVEPIMGKLDATVPPLRTITTKVDADKIVVDEQPVQAAAEG